MMTLTTLLLAIYLAVALVTFWIYLQIFLRDNSTPKTDRTSWIVLCLAAGFWPIVLPLSYLERQGHQQSRPRDYHSLKQKELQKKFSTISTGW